jgi:hypothetical protein
MKLGMNIRQPTFNIQRRIAAPRGTIGCSMLNVECWMFFIFILLLAIPRLFGQAATNELSTLVPAYGEMPPTFWEQHETTIIVGSFAMLAVVFLFLRAMLRPKTPVVLPPEVVARQALAKLQRQPEDGKVLSEVSQILRRYISVAFELPAAELTTAEFCTAIGANEKIGVEIAQTISGFLRECDERKFSSSPAVAPLNAVARALELVASAEARPSRSAPVPGAAMSPMQNAPANQQTPNSPDVAASGDGRAPR